MPPMGATMVIRVPLLTTYATVKHVDVSLPLVACLLDGEIHGPARRASVERPGITASTCAIRALSRQAGDAMRQRRAARQAVTAPLPAASLTGAARGRTNWPRIPWSSLI